MISFLRNKGIKAYNEILEIAGQPNLLFSNDREQYNAEAIYNVYTIQKLNKLIKKKNILISDLEQVFSFVETSWSAYLNKYYKGKCFVFYIWGDYQIPAIRVSVVSYYEGFELPFGCTLINVNNLQEVLLQYQEKAYFDGITINEVVESEDEANEPESKYKVIVYSKIIKC
ncbi:hypothetical protein [Paenibacillus sp. N3.4]|uniref:hypothetical protein n=1 Tax=Paenibacillus sp. N3.4 TaxID=2603222 RepID=UPI0011CAE3A9|nr:hypothetical protein [Paenibacillus sp. N3.4]TXK83449.1 hypothetical protein FU659_13750 [Paenibacillus sp. N3.4]